MDSSHRLRGQSSAQPLSRTRSGSYRRLQTTSTAHLGRSRPLAVRAWVEVSVAARSVVCRGILVVGDRGRSSLAGDCLCLDGRVASRIVSRSDCRCMRLAEGAVHSSADARRSALLVGVSAGLWGERVRACCSQAVRWRFVEVVSPGRAFAQPIECQWRAYHCRQSRRTCSGSACAGSLSGLKPLLYAIVRCVRYKGRGRKVKVASRAQKVTRGAS
jgi:hypothetical protein